MKVFIGANHEGYEFKTQLAQALQMAGHEVADVGNHNIDPNDDYSTFAKELANQLLETHDPEARGILISGDGQGMVMAANRFRGIRASLCWNRLIAQASRSDEDSNVLCLASRYLSIDEAGSIMAAWLGTPFGGDSNNSRRAQSLDNLI